MQQNLYSIAHNGATNVHLTQETQQTYHYWPAAQSGVMEVHPLHQRPHYNFRPIAPSGAMEVHQMPHCNGQGTRWVDFIRLHHCQLIYAACLRWPIPLEMS